MHPLAAHIGTGTPPVLQRDIVPEHHPDIFQNIQRGPVDSFDLLGIHRLGQRQPAGQAWQHRMVGARAKIASFASAAAAALVLLGCLCHEFAFCAGSRPLEQS